MDSICNEKKRNLCHSVHGATKHEDRRYAFACRKTLKAVRVATMHRSKLLPPGARMLPAHAVHHCHLQPAVAHMKHDALLILADLRGLTVRPCHLQPVVAAPTRPLPPRCSAQQTQSLLSHSFASSAARPHPSPTAPRPHAHPAPSHQCHQHTQYPCHGLPPRPHLCAVK